MSTRALATSEPFGLIRVWPGVLAPVAAGLLGLGLIFWPEVAAALRVWIDSTAYNHCFLILPIAMFLAWERRARFATTPIVPFPRATLLALPLGVVWLFAERVGVMEGRQLVLLALIETLFVAVLGWRLCRAFAAPLLYLVFLVPFGAFLTPQLQDFTARFSVVGLNLLGIPNYSDGYTIEIPEGTFYVAEACAGLRFLIASVAFGTLYAFVIYRSVGRRLAFVGISIVVPIIANGLRAMGIVVLGHILGSAQAAATDHILYGWIFFSIVILILTLAGLPFRQDQQPFAAVAPSAPPASPRDARATVTAAVALVALALVGPVVAGVLNARSNIATVNLPPAPLADAGCTAAPDPSATQAATENPADVPGVLARFLCDDGRISLRLRVLPARSSPSLVIDARRRLLGALASQDVDTHWHDGWRLTEAEQTDAAVATAMWIDGRSAAGGLSDRLAQARNSIVGSAYSPVLMAVSPQSDPKTPAPRGTGRAIQAFLDANAAALSARAAALSRISG